MEIFDKYASSYDKWYEMQKGKFIDKVETDAALSLLNVKEGDKILDIGCGTGNFSFKLAELGCKVTGIDISDKMLDIAKSKARQNHNIEFLNMNSLFLNFPDNMFDVVVSIAAFEFIKRKTEVFDEMLRVVKKSGKIVIGTINKTSEWGTYYKEKEKSVFQHAELITMSDLKKIYPNKIIETRECLFVPPFSNVDEFNMEKEQSLAQKKEGGFICVLWKK